MALGGAHGPGANEGSLGRGRPGDCSFKGLMGRRKWDQMVTFFVVTISLWFFSHGIDGPFIEIDGLPFLKIVNLSMANCECHNQMVIISLVCQSPLNPILSEVTRMEIQEERERKVIRKVLENLANFGIPRTMVDGTQITIVNGVYKPTYNWGAPHCTDFELPPMWLTALSEIQKSL